MFKKILCLAIAVMMVMAMATVAVSAAQVEISENAADTPAEIGADSGADTGAEGGADTAAGGNKIYFNPSSAWNDGTYSYVAFHIWAIDDPDFQGYEWGAKKQKGTDNGDGTWVYDLDAAGLTIQPGKQYAVIFRTDSGAQTYNLLFGSECIGHTASCNGTTYENPEDSSKTALAAFWDSAIDPAVQGPELKISSIGTVVGTCCPQSTSKYAMFVKFLCDSGKQGLVNAINNGGGKTAQEIIDKTAGDLGLLKGDVKKAIAEAASTGTVTSSNATETADWSKDWDESKSSLSDGEAPDAHDTGDGGNDGSGGNGGSNTDNSGSGSDGGSGSSGTTGGGSSSSSSGSSSSGTSGSGSGSQTGQETTVLFIMLGVMTAAAGVIFFARKKDRA